MAEQQPNGYIEQDEISLKELIQILIDQRILIIAITSVTLLLAAIYSFLIADPVYESTAVLNATPIGTEISIDENIQSIVDGTGLFPTSTVQTYMEQITSPQMLARVIGELGLVNEDGAAVSIGSVRSKISITNVDGTNLLQVKVNSSDPEEATAIANSLASTFIDYIDDAGQIQSRVAAAKIEEQLLIEEDNLAIKSEALSAHVTDGVSIDQLKSEINSLVEQVTSIKASINSYELSIETLEEKLAILSGELGASNHVIDSLELDTSGRIVGESIDVQTADEDALSGSLITIDYINSQSSYISTVARYDAMVEQLGSLEAELIEKQALLVEEEYKYNKLTRELDLAKQTYNAYQVRYQEAIVAAAAEIGSNSIVISSEAVVPGNPVGPNKPLNLAIGIVLGAMVGVFTAFFRAYWKAA